jgi:hypothetical protein
MLAVRAGVEASAVALQVEDLLAGHGQIDDGS